MRAPLRTRLRAPADLSLSEGAARLRTLLRGAQARCTFALGRAQRKPNRPRPASPDASPHLPPRRLARCRALSADGIMRSQAEQAVQQLSVAEPGSFFLELSKELRNDALEDRMRQQAGLIMKIHLDATVRTQRARCARARPRERPPPPPLPPPLPPSSQPPCAPPPTRKPLRARPSPPSASPPPLRTRPRTAGGCAEARAARALDVDPGRRANVH